MRFGTDCKALLLSNSDRACYTSMLRNMRLHFSHIALQKLLLVIHISAYTKKLNRYFEKNGPVLDKDPLTSFNIGRYSMDK